MKALIWLRSSGLLIALAAVALMGATGNAAAQSADEIIDAHIKAIGGMAAIAKVKTISRTGEVKVGGMMGDMAGTAKQIIVLGKKAFSEMDAGEPAHYIAPSGGSRVVSPAAGNIAQITG